MKTTFGSLAAIAVAVWPALSFAQMAGHYQGTNSEGDQVDVYVTDEGGGVFEITGFDTAGEVTCNGQNGGGYGVGFGGDLAQINGNTASFVFSGITLYAKASFSFSGQNVKGRVQFDVPELDTSHTPPKRAFACSSMKDSFKASYVGMETRERGKPSGSAWPLAK